MTESAATPVSETPSSRRPQSRRQAWLAVVVFAAVALSRVPFLDAGYGTNHDTWRVARAARHIAATGEYEVSRFPGYPLHEITCAFFRRGGAVALNGLSAAFSVAAAAAVWAIARQLHYRNALLLAVAFAATPVVFVNSVSSKDYLWALAFLLWAFHSALKRRPALCGVLFGLAVACRITSGAMLLPLALVLYRDQDWRHLVRFSACGGVTALTAFLPVLARYGSQFFTFYHEHARPALTTIITRGTMEVWGTFGVIGLIGAITAAVAFALWRTGTRPATPLPDNGVIPALITWLLLYVVAFYALPDQAGYLIPLVPAVLLLLPSFAPARAVQFACVSLVAAPWIDISANRLVVGSILSDRRERLGTLHDVERFVAVAEEKVPPGTIVVVGAWQPIIEELFHARPLRHRYVYLLQQSELEQAMNDGAPLAYATEAIRAFNYRVYGVDLAAHGARNLQQVLRSP